MLHGQGRMFLFTGFVVEYTYGDSLERAVNISHSQWAYTTYSDNLTGFQRNRLRECTRECVDVKISDEEEGIPTLFQRLYANEHACVCAIFYVLASV